MTVGMTVNFRHIGRAGAVATAGPVVSQQPHIAQPTDRPIGDFRYAIRVGPTRFQITQQFFELIRLEADQAEVEFAELQVT